MTCKTTWQATEADSVNQHMDINFGVDFECARECLDAEAGRLFRAYREIMVSGTPEAIEQARADYTDAQHRTQALRRDDAAEIRVILGE